MTAHGIFCLEIGEWYGNAKHRDSVKPILQLLEDSWDVPYIHKNASTRDELFFYLKKWVHKRYVGYPVLYLAFHGEPGAIIARKPNGQKDLVPLPDVVVELEGKCNKRIIHFGSCSTLNIHGNTLNKFVRDTGALAVTGYCDDVDWMDSSILDLIIFKNLQDRALRKDVMNRIKNKIRYRHPKLCKDLHFHMVVKK